MPQRSMSINPAEKINFYRTTFAGVQL